MGRTKTSAAGVMSSRLVLDEYCTKPELPQTSYWRRLKRSWNERY